MTPERTPAQHVALIEKLRDQDEVIRVHSWGRTSENELDTCGLCGAHRHWRDNPENKITGPWEICGYSGEVNCPRGRAAEVWRTAS
jgi:hypothetical protein